MVLYTAILSALAIASPAVASPINGGLQKRLFSWSQIRVDGENKCFDVPDGNFNVGTRIQL